MIKDTAQEYFKAFERKDINAIRVMLDPYVVLRDWEINVKGLDCVLDETTKIFDVSETIAVKVNNIYKDGNIVIGELNLIINSDQSINLVDILEFSDAGKIRAIRAYKG